MTRKSPSFINSHECMIQTTMTMTTIVGSYSFTILYYYSVKMNLLMEFQIFHTIDYFYDTTGTQS